MGCIDSFEHSGCLFDSSFIKQMGDRQADSEKRFEIYMAISPRFFSMVFHFRY